jgi:hypothetical protein
MRGLWLSREIFDFKRFGFYSLALFSHKVLRRTIPFCLLVIFACSFFLFFDGYHWKLIFLGQLVFYFIALLESTGIIRRLAGDTLIRKLTVPIFYFCIGNLGTLFGVIDFLRGVKIDKWGYNRR